MAPWANRFQASDHNPLPNASYLRFFVTNGTLSETTMTLLPTLTAHLGTYLNVVYPREKLKSFLRSYLPGSLGESPQKRGITGRKVTIE